MSQLEMLPTQEDVFKAIGFHQNTTNLLISQVEDEIDVVGTRWGPEDFIHYIKTTETNYKVFERQACTVEEDAVTKEKKFHTPIYPQRMNGKPAFPISALMDIHEQNPLMFWTLYMNMPQDPSRQIFTNDIIGTYKSLPSGGYNVIIVDPAFSKAKTACDTAMVVVYVAPNTMWYVNSYILEKLSPHEMCEKFCGLVKFYKPRRCAVEEVAGQIAVTYNLQTALRMKGLNVPIEKVAPGGTHKEDRIRGLHPLFHSGGILIRPWMDALNNQLKSFPLGMKRDLIDALAYMLFMSIKRPQTEPAKVITENDAMCSMEHILRQAYKKTKDAEAQEVSLHATDIMREHFDVDAFIEFQDRRLQNASAM